MPWPLSQDYNEAVQDPAIAFGDTELKGGELQLNAYGMPLPRSGNFADVYEVTCPATQTKWAVKCFTRQVPGLRERYTAISKHLKDANLPFAVDFQFLERGIRIRGDWFPVLKMRWVEGLLLNEFVRDNLDKPVLLQALGQIWLRMSRRLREADVAHCDLQHGNVLLVPGSKQTALAVKLIDYDGMWVPALAKLKSNEVGHPNYQHPQRSKDGTYDAEVDRFPLLVVATAMRAVSVGGRSLWERYDNGDNLLFKETDILGPDNSPVFRELGAASDPLLRQLVGRLRQACRERLQQTPLLEEVVPEEKPTAVQPKSSVPKVAAPPVPVWGFEAGSPEKPIQRTNGQRATKQPDRGGRRPRRAWAWWTGGVLAVLVAMGTLAGVLLLDDGPGPFVFNTPAPTTHPDVAPPPLTFPAPLVTHPDPPLTRPTPPVTRPDPPITRPDPPITRPTPPRTRPAPPRTMANLPPPPPPPPPPPTTEKPKPPKGFAQGRLFRMLGRSNDLIAVSGDKDSSWRLYSSLDNRITQRFSADTNAPVVAFDATPDGAFAVAAAEDGVVSLWDVKTGLRPNTLARDRRRYTVVAIAANGRMFAAGDGGKNIEIIDRQAPTEQRTISLPGNVGVMALSPDGAWLACGQVGEAGEKQSLWLVDTATGTLRNTAGGHVGTVTAAAFSPDGQRLASASTEQHIRFWRTSPPAPENTVGPLIGEVRGLTFSADGSKVIAETKDEWAVLVAGGNQVLARSAKAPGVPIAWAFEPDSEKVTAIFVPKDETVRRKNVPLQAITPPKPLVVQRKPILQLLGNTTDLVAVEDPDPSVWRLVHRKTDRRDSRISSHNGPILCVSASLDGKFVITGSEDRTARVRDTTTVTGLAVLRGHTRPVVAVALSPDGKRALTADGGNDVILWDVAKQAELQRFPIKAAVTAVAFSADGQSIAAGATDTDKPQPNGLLWYQVLEGARAGATNRFVSRPSPISCVTFSADGNNLAGISFDSSLAVMDLRTNMGFVTRFTFKDGPRELRFSPDGKRLLVTWNQGGLVWGTVSHNVEENYQSGDRPLTATFVEGAAGLVQAYLSADGTITWVQGAAPAAAPMVVVKPPPPPPPVPPPRPVVRPQARKPVPTKEELAAADKDMREQFKDLFRTKSPKLTEELNRYAFGGGEQSSANRFAALKELRHQRAQEGDLGNALHVAREMSRLYDLDGLQSKVETVEAATPHVKATFAPFYVQTLLGLISEARGEDRLDMAVRLAKAATTLAARGSPPSSRAMVAVATKDLMDEQAAIKRVTEALAKLETAPDDAEANLTVGRFRCRQERWGEAARRLAKASEAGLRGVAEKELADPADAAGRKAIAAAWDALAKKEAVRAQSTAYCCRSMFWYRQALLVATLAETVAIQADLRAMERRVPDFADPWRDLDLSALPEADRKKDLLHLDRNKQVQTRMWYKGGVDVTVVARTPKTNIRLAAGRGGQVLFNWEGAEGGLRVHRPDNMFDDPRFHLPGSLLKGKPDVVLKVNEWHTLRWQLTPSAQKVWVDHEVVLEEAGTWDLTPVRPVVVFSTDSPIDVKSVAVRDLGLDAGGTK